MNERIAKMASYVKSNDIYPPTVGVQFDPFDDELPEALKNAKRLKEYMAAQTVRLDD